MSPESGYRFRDKDMRKTKACLPEVVTGSRMKTCEKQRASSWRNFYAGWAIDVLTILAAFGRNCASSRAVTGWHGAAMAPGASISDEKINNRQDLAAISG
jgi:hypothetical protein